MSSLVAIFSAGCETHAQLKPREKNKTVFTFAMFNLSSPLLVIDLTFKPQNDGEGGFAREIRSEGFGGTSQGESLELLVF